jgi:hypothetical protein
MTPILLATALPGAFYGNRMVPSSDFEGTYVRQLHFA